MSTKLALIGFGNVAQGFVQILQQRGDRLRRQYGLDLRITAVSDILKGSICDPQGLDPGRLLAAAQTDAGLESLEAPNRGWDALQTISESGADVVLELTPTDLDTGEPAATHVKKALRMGKHVVTTNKGPVALFYDQLASLAHENGVEIGVEGTVLSGTPAIGLGVEYLAVTGVDRFEGILNGTTNYILTRMESGATYANALADAQRQGYAEADPTGDVDGHDAAGKVVILANLVMGASLTMADVRCQGISDLESHEVVAAASDGEHWKLIGSAERTERGIEACVQPRRLAADHPLSAIRDATNAITFTTDLLGQVTLVGPGAGRLETGFALVADLLAIHRRQRQKA